MTQKIKTVYVSGPMTGVPYFNFPAFDRAAKRLRKRGFIVFSPAETDREAGILPDPKGDPIPPELYEQLLAADIELVRQVDAVFVLPHWTGSYGARAEVREALRLGKPVMSVATLRPARIPKNV